MMEIPEGKVSLLDAVPVRCGHITTEWEGECAVLAYPRFKYEWMRRFLLPKGMSPDIHVRLEEHGLESDRWTSYRARNHLSTCQALWGGRELYSPGHRLRNAVA